MDQHGPLGPLKALGPWFDFSVPYRDSVLKRLFIPWINVQSTFFSIGVFYTTPILKLLVNSVPYIYCILILKRPLTLLNKSTKAIMVRKPIMVSSYS